MPGHARHPLSVAIAACSFVLPMPDGGRKFEIQLTPAGHFKPSDGRDKVPADGWWINADIAAKLIQRFRRRKNARVLDYEHQTLNSQGNGQPAPAAGWITDLVWHEGTGLFAQVELTARARQFIQDGEYKYVSPVFVYDAKSGEILDVQMAALTNDPGIDGMRELELRAAATYGNSAFYDSEEETMNKLFLAVCAALALKADDTTEDQAVTALKSHMEADPLATLRQSLDLNEDADVESIGTAVTALKSKAKAAGNPDPSKYVPLDDLKAVRGELATLRNQVTGNEVNQLIEAALEDGSLLEQQKDWATKLGKSDIAALRSYLDTAQPIAALKGTQTKGKSPQGTDTDVDQLDEGELAVCRATGITPEEFVKSKKEEAAAAA